MRDQYGCKVPTDLVAIDFAFGDEDMLRKIMEAEWYKVEGYEVLLVSANQVDHLCEANPIDCGLPHKWRKVPIQKVAGPLKRYDKIVGFYHA